MVQILEELLIKIFLKICQSFFIEWRFWQYLIIALLCKGLEYGVVPLDTFFILFEDLTEVGILILTLLLNPVLFHGFVHYFIVIAFRAHNCIIAPRLFDRFSDNLSISISCHFFILTHKCHRLNSFRNAESFIV